MILLGMTTHIIQVALLCLSPMFFYTQRFSLGSKTQCLQTSVKKFQPFNTNQMHYLVNFIIVFHTFRAHCKAMVSSDLNSLDS
jgi:hypothetical protein